MATLSISCPHHPFRQLTNFCSSENCMVSLCPECLPSHLRSGNCDNIHIEVLDQAISKARLKAEQSVKELSTNMSSLAEKRASIIAENQKLNKQAIETARQELHKAIDDFFKTLNRKIGVEDSEEKVQRTLKKYQKFKEEINDSLKLISHPTYLNQSLKTLFTIDTKAFLLNLRSETDFLFSNSTIYKVSFLPGCFAALNELLESGVEINEYQQPFIQNNLYVQQNNEIVLADYFKESCEFKIIHEFSPENSSIVLSSLTTILPNNNLKQRRLALSSPEIPQDCRSIISHAGDVYLLGGINRSGKLNRHVYRFNFDLNSLESIGSLIAPRRDPSVAYMNGFIYVVSGRGEQNQHSRRAEAFNINSRQSMELSPCRYPSAGASLCLFQSRYLLKLGGFDNNQFISVLEKYDIRKNTWSQIQLRFSESIPPKIATLFVFKPYALAQSISSDSIVITGGDEQSLYNESVAILSEQSEECFKVRAIQPHRLPEKGFFLSLPIVHKNTIHTLYHNQGNKIKLLVTDLNDWITIT